MTCYYPSRRPSVRRTAYAKRRLQELRATRPYLPADVLDRCSLRHLSYNAKRFGQDQTLLRVDTPGDDDSTASLLGSAPLGSLGAAPISPGCLLGPRGVSGSLDGLMF